MRSTKAQDVWKRVEMGPVSACWNWTGTVTRARLGYGQIVHNHKRDLAHRVVYQLANGPIPVGMSVMHTCDNSLCCNPSHLRLGTHTENMWDMKTKGRAKTGKGVVGQKLRDAINWATWHDVLPYATIAKTLNVSDTTVRYIVPKQVGDVNHKKVVGWKELSI